MKNLFTLLFFLILNAVNGQPITSTFDTDTDGWIVTGDATSAVPNFIATGGNPGGYASADDTAAGGVWVWSAPEKFLGDQSESYSKQLSFDLKQSSLDSQFDDSDILIISPEVTIILDLPNNPGIDWTHYSVKLDNTLPWRINTLFGELATGDQIQSALSNIISLKIRGEYVSGNDTGGLDNVVLETNSLSANDYVSNLVFQVYPNPSDGIFNIHSDEISHTSQITVFDLNGRIVHHQKSESKILNLQKIQSGIYIAKVTSNEMTYSQKIIKN